MYNLKWRESRTEAHYRKRRTVIGNNTNTARERRPVKTLVEPSPSYVHIQVREKQTNRLVEVSQSARTACRLIYHRSRYAGA
jgi:hypothetical protein